MKIVIRFRVMVHHHPFLNQFSSPASYQSNLMKKAVLSFLENISFRIEFTKDRAKTSTKLVKTPKNDLKQTLVNNWKVR